MHSSEVVNEIDRSSIRKPARPRLCAARTTPRCSMRNAHKTFASSLYVDDSGKARTQKCGAAMFQFEIFAS
jgi:hypothetical protein